MAIENKYGKSAVDATRKNTLPPWLDTILIQTDWPIGLGGTYIPPGSNLNTYTSYGLYYQNANANMSSITNAPSALAGRLIVSSGTGKDNAYRIQEWITYKGTKWMRYTENTGGTWTPWVIQPNFVPNAFTSRPTNGNSLSRPEGAVGGMMKTIATSSMTTGKPSGNPDGHLLHFFWDSENLWDSQLLLGNGASRIYYRRQNNGTWQNWQEVFTEESPGAYIFRGSNITTTTLAGWKTRPFGLYYYSSLNQVNEQPSQYGWLLHWYTGSEIRQVWLTQSIGNILHRGANSSGWNGSASDSGTWRKLWDSNNMTYSLSGTTLTITTS